MRDVRELTNLSREELLSEVHEREAMLRGRSKEVEHYRDQVASLTARQHSMEKALKEERATSEGHRRILFEKADEFWRAERAECEALKITSVLSRVLTEMSAAGTTLQGNATMVEALMLIAAINKRENGVL
jgi:hypothetical protein